MSPVITIPATTKREKSPLLPCHSQPANRLTPTTFPERKGVSKLNRHDMDSLKRLEIDALRQGAAGGHKVFYIWGRAELDYGVWQVLKQASGIYFLNRE